MREYNWADYEEVGTPFRKDGLYWDAMYEPSFYAAPKDFCIIKANNTEYMGLPEVLVRWWGLDITENSIAPQLLELTPPTREVYSVSYHLLIGRLALLRQISYQDHARCLHICSGIWPNIGLLLMDLLDQLQLHQVSGLRHHAWCSWVQRESPKDASPGMWTDVGRLWHDQFKVIAFRKHKAWLNRRFRFLLDVWNIGGLRALELLHQGECPIECPIGAGLDFNPFRFNIDPEKMKEILSNVRQY